MNSRYYDPELGRFINADDINTLDITQITQNGLNLYAYCLNNPVNNIDENGYFITWLLGLFITTLVFAIVNTTFQLVKDITNYIATGSWNSGWEDYFGAFIGGFLGGFTFFVTGNLSLAFGITAGIETFTTSMLTNATGKTNYSIESIAFRSIAAGLLSGLLAKFLGGTKATGITIGRKNMLAIFKSGVTKLARGSASKMSAKVILKGIIGLFTLKSVGSIGSGIFSSIVEWMKYLFSGDSNGIGYSN